LRAWRQQVLPLLKSGEQSVARGRSRASSALVILQFAFSVLLLTSAGLAYRSLSMLDSGEVGYDPSQLLLVTVRAGRTSAFVASEPGAVEREGRLALLERVRERLAAVPNVEAVSYSRRRPGAYFLGTTPVERPGLSERVQAFIRPVGPGYLTMLRLTPSVGREIGTIDRSGSRRTAVINRQLARALWPDGSPIGQTLVLGERREPAEIVGVTPDALFDGPVHDPHPNYVLLAEQQFPGPLSVDPTFYIRHRGALEAIAPLVGRAIAETDADLPIVSMATMMERLESVTVLERQVSTLLVAFALLSLLVATLGQYAVAMFNMRRRTRDFGVRMALGASASLIQREVIGEALRLTVAGLTIGFALSAAAGAAFRSVLFGVTPTDPLTYAGVFALLAAASIAAAYLPAWRAGRVNVVEALRQE
jgi:predicted permease